MPFIRDNMPGRGLSLLAAAVLLGIMILPTIITVAQSALDAVPKKYYEGALALGADHERSVFRVIVPAAVSGIMAGIVLGVGRAIGETMAVIMVAGNQPLIPESIFNGVRTMTVGTVSMDMLAVDLTPCPQAGIGTPVELWGKEIKIDDVAAAAGTVGYELMCALALRVPVVTV